MIRWKDNNVAFYNFYAQLKYITDRITPAEMECQQLTVRGLLKDYLRNFEFKNRESKCTRQFINILKQREETFQSFKDFRLAMLGVHETISRAFALTDNMTEEKDLVRVNHDN